MVLRRIAILSSIALAVCLNACVAIAHAVADTIRYAIELIASPFTPALAVEGWADLGHGSRGTALDRALQNDMRHEAGVPRRSAARHI